MIIITARRSHLGTSRVISGVKNVSFFSSFNNTNFARLHIYQ